jgi:hypothetical protein
VAVSETRIGYGHNYCQGDRLRSFIECSVRTVVLGNNR